MLERIDAGDVSIPARRHAAVRGVRLGAARQELPRRLERRRTVTCSSGIWRPSATRARRPFSPSRASSTARHRIELEANLLPLLHAGNDHPHHRRHERCLIAALARTPSRCAAGISCTISWSGPMGARTRSPSALGQQAPFQPACRPGVRVGQGRAAAHFVCSTAAAPAASTTSARPQQRLRNRRSRTHAPRPSARRRALVQRARNGASIRASLKSIPR